MRIQLPEPLHGWREFIHEITIIVLGVLIALAAQQVVEAFQWRVKVHRAEAAMRLELAEDDGPQAYGRMLIARCLDEQIARIHDGAGHVPASQLRQWVQDYSPPFRGWDVEAWHVVLGSDAGSHMGAERLIQWSSPYRVLVGLTDRNEHERQLSTQLHEALPPSGEPSPADLQEMRRLAAELRNTNFAFSRASQLILVRSQALGAGVPEPTRRALIDQARALYGDCARAPDLNARPAAQNLGADLRLGGGSLTSQPKRDSLSDRGEGSR